MKILLLGEFSGLHKNLKEGLLELGHNVTIASHGDDYRDIERDIDLKTSGNIITKNIKSFEKNFSLIKLVQNYDVVQLVNAFIFYRSKFPYLLNIIFYKNLIKNSRKFYILAAGDDAYFWKFGRERLSYGPFEDFLKFDYKSKKDFYLTTKKAFEFNDYIADLCDGIIPVMYEYEISYKDHKKLLKTIPLPINTKKINYKENIIKDKIVIFHGLSRYGFKGTRFVEKAFEILREKYPKDLELIIDGSLPIHKYLNILERANIIIDQTNSYSLGMNGIYAMAMGKVVLGGAEPESLKSLGVENSPAINIKPNAESIVEAIEKIIHNPKSIAEIGYQSRIYVEKVHDYIEVAKRYIDAWGDK